MRRGVCVKCQGTEIYSVPVAAAGKYQDLWLGGLVKRGSFFLVCATCGYSERYVKPEMLSELARYGERLTPR